MILKYFQQYGIIFSIYLGLYLSILVYFGLSQAIPGCLGLSRAISVYLGLSLSIPDHLDISGYCRLYPAISGYLELYLAICGHRHILLFLAIPGCLRLSSSSIKYQKTSCYLKLFCYQKAVRIKFFCAFPFFSSMFKNAWFFIPSFHN